MSAYPEFERATDASRPIDIKSQELSIRIERVRLILRDADVSVEDAIQQVGVSDVPSFRKIFRRELGLSPAEFRRRLRAE